MAEYRIYRNREKDGPFDIVSLLDGRFLIFGGNVTNSMQVDSREDLLLLGELIQLALEMESE